MAIPSEAQFQGQESAGPKRVLKYVYTPDEAEEARIENLQNGDGLGYADAFEKVTGHRYIAPVYEMPDTTVVPQVKVEPFAEVAEAIPEIEAAPKVIPEIKLSAEEQYEVTQRGLALSRAVLDFVQRPETRALLKPLGQDGKNQLISEFIKEYEETLNQES